MAQHSCFIFTKHRITVQQTAKTTIPSPPRSTASSVILEYSPCRGSYSSMHLGHIEVVLLWMDHTGLPEIRAINYNYKCLCLGHIEEKIHLNSGNIHGLQISIFQFAMLAYHTRSCHTSINSVNLNLPALFCPSFCL